MKYYTVPELSKLIGISDEAIGAHISAGRLIAINVGNGPSKPRWRISQDDLDAFLNARRTSPHAARAAKRKQQSTGEVEFV